LLPIILSKLITNAVIILPNITTTNNNSISVNALLFIILEEGNPYPFRVGEEFRPFT